MLTLESSNHNAAFLDHSRLINEAYNASEHAHTAYHLKAHLFSFKQKNQTTINLTTAKTRKRKSDNNILSLETVELRNATSAILTKLKQTTTFANTPTDFGTTERIWEEPTIFPQLKGANATNQFQKFTLNDNEYLIPPGCKFFNHDLLKLEEISSCLETYDFVVIDPPWRNKYIRRIKKAKQELGYQMMHNDMLSDIPLSEFIHSKSIVAVWCTNSQQHQRALLEEFLPRWDLCLVHKIVWLKLNTEGTLIGEINDGDKKQPYEALFIARHRESQQDFSKLKETEFLLSIPSIVHSHKPPLIELFRDALPEDPKCLELFARYLQPGFTSIGLEVLKLMDARLYSQMDNSR